MKRQTKALAIVLALSPVLVHCAGSDQEDDQFLDQDDGDEAGNEEAASDQENSSSNEATADDNSSSESNSESTDTATEDEGGGGEDFSSMLAAMVEQQKKAGKDVPTTKPAKAAKASSGSAATGAATTPESVPDGGPQPMWVFVERATVLAAPDAGAQKLGELKYGQKVTVVAQQNDFYKLADGQFVRVTHLNDRKAKFGKGTQQTAFKSSGGKGVYVVKSETLAVRSAPNLTAKVVGYRKQNQPVKVLKDTNGWAQIGPNQYVRSKYLTSGDAKAQPVIGSGNSVFAVKSQALYIRSSPDRNASVVGVLTEGNKVRVSNTSDGWSQIGPGRYIRTKHLVPLAH